ncbi:prepilin-type N-terminal cleavage/methylation domain-containing protein [Aeoliella sp. SH292]|uniref:prepilin-type N-terminal cleavage/methylation domain-containing protein n=1 Tax=Aeoliella sp. SH292 TaxID=3454464 RepID=UPI003F9730A8
MLQPAHQRRTAFTLIELLLVLALLVVITGFTVLSLEGSILRSKLRKGVDQVRTSWSDARLQAVSGGQRMAFSCVIGGRDYRLSSVGDMLAPQEGASPAGATGELPEGILFRSLEAASHVDVMGATAMPHIDDGQWSPPVVFNADGTSYDAVVILEEDSGKQVQVSLRGMTCTADVNDVPSARDLR